MLHYLWIIIIGFVAGLIAKFIMPGDNEPTGFIMTAVLGIVGSLLANFVAVKFGWASGSEGVSLLSGVVGAVVILFAYSFIASRTASY